jgi:hypothetical protein
MPADMTLREFSRIGGRPGTSRRPEVARALPPGWLDGLVAAGVIAALLKGLKCEAYYARWIGLAPAIPCLIALIAPSYRRRLSDFVRNLWGRLDHVRATRGRLPWAAALTFAAIPAALLNLSNGETRGAGDTRPAMLTAIRLATEGDCRLDEFCRDGYLRREIEETGRLPFFLQRRGGHIYSSYPAGMVTFALPVAVLSRTVGAHFDDPRVRSRLEKLAAALVGALGIGLFFLAALHLAPPAPAWTATAILAAGSGMFSTVGQGLWQQGGIVVWSLVVLLVEFREHRNPTRAGTVLQGLACGMLPACRLTAATFLLPFGAWVFARSPRRALAIAGVAALAYLPWALGYHVVYGTPFGPSSSQMDRACWTWSIGWPLAGVLVSPGRGLLLYQPWLVLALLSFVPAIRRSAARCGCGGEPAGWPGFCIAAVVFQIGVVAAWSLWWGGWCWGSRLATEVLPLCALLAMTPIAALGQSASGRRLILTLAIAGLLMQVPHVYLGANQWNQLTDVDAHPDALWSWSRAPFLMPWTGKGAF